MERRGSFNKIGLMTAVLAMAASQSAVAMGSLANSMSSLATGNAARPHKRGYRSGGSNASYRPTQWEKDNLWPAHRERIEKQRQRKLAKARYDAIGVTAH